MSDIERELRDSLAENARHAPAGGGLAERIIADAQLGRGARDRRTARSRWRAWSLPAIAAACVAAVVASIVVAGALQHRKTHSANTPIPSTTPPPTSAAATSSAAPTTTAASSSHATSTSPTSTAPGVGPIPKDFQVNDVTFVGTVDGWALGSGQCFQRPSQRCTALLRTSDGGQNWTSIMNPPASIGGSCQECIEHIRFANETIGYAYGQNALFMTSDGGAHWTPQAGGADALETLSGNVIRVTDTGGCPPGCSYRVLTAAVGSDQWQAVQLPGSASGDSVLLNRTGHAAYLLIQQHPAGGAGMQQPTLLTSSNDGRSWSDPGTPCPQDPGRGEIDAQLMTTAEDGSVTLVCGVRGGSPSGQFTVTSTNGGTTFRPGSRGAFSDLADALGAASGSVLLASADDTYRSTNSGLSWNRLGAAGPGRVSWIGFENASVGRAISGDYRTIWTTTDAGATWRPYRFG
jgi:photosystem II stability/assembly factor-like uncharacterized protein